MRKRSNLTSNELRDYDHDLEVRPDGRPPFRTTVREKLWITGLRPKEGDVLRVKFDPDSLETVFDFEGDPRYDVDALEAQTADRRRETAALRGRIAERNEVVPPGEAPDQLGQLERLVRLRDAGALTDAEFAVQKARILGG
ncbi:MAG: SHOCT domain-containing protein [Solirubrobacteraceae bacterium]